MEEIKARGARMSEAAIRLTDVRKSFGPTPIIMGVSLDIARGERHAIIGPNGAGKTTLFNLISGRLPVSSGRIELDGHRSTGCPPTASTASACRGAFRSPRSSRA